jgi:hypothetical protein
MVKVTVITAHTTRTASIGVEKGMPAHHIAAINEPGKKIATASGSQVRRPTGDDVGRGRSRMSGVGVTMVDIITEWTLERICWLESRRRQFCPDRAFAFALTLTPRQLDANWRDRDDCALRSSRLARQPNCWDPDMRDSMAWMLVASAWLLAVASCGLKQFRDACGI